MLSFNKCRALAPHITALLLLSFLTARLWSNLRFLRWVRRKATTSVAQKLPVSVLVPARNEAATISSCVTSLLRQDYHHSEIIVLNDGSTDDTAEQLAALSALYPQLKVVHSTEDPPLGWNGKSYACHRLASLAAGEWLLFTDADTIHTPESVRQGITQAMSLDVALLSAMPRQRTETWSERILVSFIIDFLPLIGLDLRAVWRDSSNRVAANGQYLLVHAASYREVGGHAAIGSELIDDFALANRFRSFGHRIALVDGTRMLSCRMYHTFGEVWDGFSKNLVLALESSRASRRSVWWALIFAWCYACLFVIPFFNAVFSKDKWLASIEICWLGLMRSMSCWYLKRSPTEVFTTPLAAWSVMAIGLGMLYRRWRKQKFTWKGRIYPS